MTNTKKAACIAVLLLLPILGCASRKAQPLIIQRTDRCWLPPPEEVPKDDLFALAKQLVEEDQKALVPNIAEADEASLLRAMWESLPEEKKGALADSVSELIQILSHDVAKKRSVIFGHQRLRAVQEFHHAYTEAFLTTYKELYRRKIADGTCRPLRIDEEERLISQSQSVALKAGKAAADVERNRIYTDTLDRCFLALESTKPAWLKQIREIALDAALIGAEKRSNPIEAESCGSFASRFSIAVDVKYDRAYEEMATTLTEIAEGMKRRATMQRPYLSFMAHLYAVQKVITEAQEKKSDIYRSPLHPTLALSLESIVYLREIDRTWRAESIKGGESYLQLSLEKAGGYLQTIERILFRYNEKGMKPDPDVQNKLEQMEREILYLREEISRAVPDLYYYKKSSAPESADVTDAICQTKLRKWQDLLSQTIDKYRETFSDPSSVDVLACTPGTMPHSRFPISAVYPQMSGVFPTESASCCEVSPTATESLPGDDEPDSGLPSLSHLTPWTAHLELPRHLTSKLEYGYINYAYQMLRAAVQRAGLEARVYRFGRRGLALVTQFEKIEDDGRPFPGLERWNVTAIPSTKGWSLIDRFFEKRTGRYRFFILLLTEPKDFRHTGQNMNWKRAMQVTKDGGGIPSDDYLNQSFDGLKVAVVVYEYFRKDEHSEPQFVERRLPARRHIAGARLWLGNDLDKPIDFQALVACSTGDE